MTTNQQRIERVAIYLRKIGKMAEKGDVEAIKLEVRLALQLIGEKP